MTIDLNVSSVPIVNERALSLSLISASLFNSIISLGVFMSQVYHIGHRLSSK